MKRDEAAISSVLGAILVFALIVITLVTIQVEFAPRWEEDREARHMANAVDQLGVFASDLERLATNTTRGGVTDPLTVLPESGFRFFRANSVARGELAFEPSGSGQGVVLTSPLLRVQVRDGEELFGLEEDWNAIPSSGTVADIVKVRHLRVRVDMIPGDYDEGDSATLSILDANNNFAGRAVVIFRDFPSEQALETRVYNAANQEISSGIEAFFQQTNVEYFYIDLLDDGLLFRDVLAAAAKPMTLQLSHNGLTADYTVVFTDGSGGGAGSSGGLLLPNYSQTLPSGSFQLRAGYQHLPEQTFIVEHGAILVVQPDGAAMLVPPNFGVSSTAQQAVLDLVIPGLDGAQSTLGGLRSASLVARASGERTQIEALAARVSFTLPTAYPDVWAAYLDDLFTLAGLSPDSPDPQYSVLAAGNAVQVTLFGPIGAPADATEDVFLRFQQATLQLQLVPSS